MTANRILELYKTYEDLTFETESLTNKHSTHRDLNAFIIMASLMPPTKLIITAAGHDVVYFGLDENYIPDNQEGEEIIKDLIRCGINFSRTEGFYSFV